MPRTLVNLLRSALMCSVASLLFVAPLNAATCSVTAAVLTFGQYDRLSNIPNTTPGLVRVSCTKDPLAITETVALTLLLLPSTPGVGGSRKMDSGAASLPFDMFTDVLRTRLWGDGSQGTFVISGVLVLTAVNTPSVIEFPVYGRIPTGANSPVGPYTGQFAITLNY